MASGCGTISPLCRGLPLWWSCQGVLLQSCRSGTGLGLSLRGFFFFQVESTNQQEHKHTPPLLTRNIGTDFFHPTRIVGPGHCSATLVVLTARERVQMPPRSGSGLRLLGQLQCSAVLNDKRLRHYFSPVSGTASLAEWSRRPPADLGVNPACPCGGYLFFRSSQTSIS